MIVHVHCTESADVLVLAVPQCCAYYKYVCRLVPMSPCLADKYHCDGDPLYHPSKHSSSVLFYEGKGMSIQCRWFLSSGVLGSPCFCRE